MNFDYTYLVLFGHPVFEPVVILTNLIFLSLSVYFFKRLTASKQPYARQMALFILMMGISGGFGAIAHGAHYSFGSRFFNTSFFLVNAFSLISVYYCFRGPYTLYTRNPNKYVIGGVLAWVSVLMIFSFIQGEFLLIKIHAGIVLIYSLVVHSIMYRRSHESGNRIVVTGIAISFLSIIVHSLRFSFGKWFNYKDIAHVIMIITLSVIYWGVSLNVKALDEKAQPG